MAEYESYLECSLLELHNIPHLRHKASTDGYLQQYVRSQRELRERSKDKNASWIYHEVELDNEDMKYVQDRISSLPEEVLDDTNGRSQELDEIGRLVEES